MTSPFVDRVEYQVIGRDNNASRVFRDVADAADSAGDSVGGLGSDLDRFNRSVDETADRLRRLQSELRDLDDVRTITITTNIREVLGSVEDNRQVIDLISNRFENLTITVDATVNSLVRLNDGITTIEDNRNVVINLGNDVRALTQNIDATVDSVVRLGDGLTTIDDNRNVVIDLGNDVRALTQNIDATVDSVVRLGDGITTIDDNRNVVIDLGNDVRELTSNIDATVDSVVRLSDGITTIDDNRNVVIDLGSDVRALTADIDATVDSVVRLSDGITTIDDNRNVVIDLGSDIRALTSDIDATVDSVVRLGDGITTIDDNRTAVIDLGSDVRALTSDVDATVDSVVRLSDGITTIDDNRAAITDLDGDVRTLTSDVDATVDSVVRLNDGVTTIDDNRAAITNIGNDFRTLRDDVDGTAQGITTFGDGLTRVDDNRAAITNIGNDFRNLRTDVDGTAQGITAFGDGIARVGDNRAAITGVRDDVNQLTTDVDRSRVAITQLGDGVNAVDDNRNAIAVIREDFRTIGDGVEASRQIVIRFNDEVGRVDDNRAGLTGLGDDFGTLAERVNAARGRIEDLNRSTRDTRDIDINQDVDVNQQVVKTISSDRDRLERAGLAAGAAVGGGLIAGLSNLLVGAIPSSFMKGLSATAVAIGSAGTGVLAGAITFLAGGIAATLTTALGGAILLGLGGSVIAAGLLLAARDPRVQNAAKLTGNEIMRSLGSAASSFTQPVIDALGIVRTEITKMGPQLGQLFGSASQYVVPLTQALMGFARNALPGITSAMGKLKPVFDQLGESLPKLGTTVGNFFDDIADYAPEMARALGLVLAVVDRAIALFGWLFKRAAELFSFLDAGALTIQSAWGKVKGFFSDSAQAAPAAEAAIEGVGGAMGTAATKAAEAAAKTAGFKGSLDQLMGAANQFIGLGDSQAAMYDAMRAATERATGATTKNTAGINLSTEAGSLNWQALARIAGSANAAAQQILDMKGTQEQANAVTAVARQRFLETARAFGIGSAAAEALADSMFGIPNVKRDVFVDTSQATGAVTRIKKAIQGVNGKTVYIDVVMRDSGPKRDQGERIPGVGLIPKWASGGAVFGPGLKGVDSKLAVLAPGEHVFTAAEVDAAGGHQAIFALRRSLLGHGPANPSATAAPGRRAAASGMDAQTLAAAMRRAFSGMTLTIDDRSGRTAQLIARAGG